MQKFFIVSLLIIIGIGLFFYFNPRSYNYVKFNLKEPTGFASTGLDVSHHQGKINWDQLLAKDNFISIDFVYLKATEGQNHTDTQWKRNRKVLLKKKVKHGAYHFMATKSYPWPQVKHFLNTYSYKKGDLPPVLDVETEGISDEDLIAKMKVWLDAVENKIGIRPIIYTSNNFYNTKFKNKFPKTKFWLAAYSKKPEHLDDTAVIHWQWTESVSINGCSEKVDLNVSKLNFN